MPCVVEEKKEEDSIHSNNSRAANKIPCFKQQIVLNGKKGRGKASDGEVLAEPIDGRKRGNALLNPIGGVRATSHATTHWERVITKKARESISLPSG